MLKLDSKLECCSTLEVVKNNFSLELTCELELRFIFNSLGFFCSLVYNVVFLFNLGQMFLSAL